MKEGWKNVVLHDCSNEVKFYRGVNACNKGEAFGTLHYAGNMDLPESFYRRCSKEMIWYGAKNIIFLFHSF